MYPSAWILSRARQFDPRSISLHPAIECVKSLSAYLGGYPPLLHSCEYVKRVVRDYITYQAFPTTDLYYPPMSLLPVGPQTPSPFEYESLLPTMLAHWNHASATSFRAPAYNSRLYLWLNRACLSMQSHFSPSPFRLTEEIVGSARRSALWFLEVSEAHQPVWKLVSWRGNAQVSSPHFEDILKAFV